MVSILLSHTGSHSADDWAMATASEIFNTESIQDGRKLAAQQAKLGIASALSGFYQAVMEIERECLASDPGHCDRPIDASDHAYAAVKMITTGVSGHPWEDKLKSDEWQHHARITIIDHMQTAQHVERLWHADNNPDNQSATAYKARYTG